MLRIQGGEHCKQQNISARPNRNQNADTDMADTNIPFADTDILVSVSAKYIG